MKLVKPKKFLGQHFLKDLQVAKDIADTVDTCPDLPILEVGPGMGVLTQFLIPNWILNQLLTYGRILQSWVTILLNRTF